MPQMQGPERQGGAGSQAASPGRADTEEQGSPSKEARLRDLDGSLEPLSWVGTPDGDSQNTSKAGRDTWLHVALLPIIAREHSSDFFSNRKLLS